MKIRLITLFINICLFQSLFCQKIDSTKFVQNPKVILVDIGGTLVDIDLNKVTLKYLGLGNALRSISIKRGVKNFYLNKLYEIKTKFATKANNFKWINGKQMPPLLKASMSGLISWNDCLKIGNNWIEKNSNKFKNDFEKKFFKLIFNFNFNPILFTKFLNYTKTMDLIEELYKSVDENNKRKNVIIILSNQAKDMINPLKINFPKIFKFSDAQIFSCYESLIKPNPKIFEKCLNLCPLKSYKHCFFIDDEKPNIEAVKKMNIKGFTIEGLYPKEAREGLSKFAII